MKTSPSLQGNWDWRAAGNFIGGGSGSGLLVSAALLSLTGIVNITSVLAATVLIATGLGLVWLEIGRPLRFLNVFRNPQTSWMSRESWLAIVLLPLALAAAWYGKSLLFAAVGVVAVLFLYSQARILRAAKSIAAWRVAPVVPLIMITGFTEGAGLMLLIWAASAGLREAVGLLDIILVSWLLLIWRLVAWSDYRAAATRDVPEQTRVVILGLHRPLSWWGHIIPALLVLSAPVSVGAASTLVALAGLCMTLSGWWLKFIIITRAAFNNGFALPRSPARGAGEPGPGVRPGWSPG